MTITKLGFYLSSVLSVIFFVFSSWSLYLYMTGTSVFLEFDLVGSMNSCLVVYLILLDWMSCMFISVVSLISMIVLIYSVSYMSLDFNQNKFIMLVFLFVLSMFLMILSPNLISILLGWDGLGLVSYGLVIYYNNWKSFNSGMITFLSNRLGDLSLIVSICWVLNFGGSGLLEFQAYYSDHRLSSILLFTVMLGAMTKSAQIPFSAWLPAAMAAPTPVSSLVHSSTLVTAGVYLLIRFNFLSGGSYYLLIVSLLTMMMSGLSAMFETDLKKIIALSTLSQLGVMMFILSLGCQELGFFHLVTHALFKSLLFLCAGFYIHSNLNWQDSRLFTSSMSVYPVFSMYFSVASLALSGFPFLAGFYSKDLIIEYFFTRGGSLLVMFMLITATLLSLMYSLRLVFMIFLFSSKKVNVLTSEDWVMGVPMTLLFVLSISSGSILSWVVFPGNFIFIPFLMKVVVITLLTLSYLCMSLYTSTHFSFPLLWFLGLMWNIPSISSVMMVYYLNKTVHYVKLFDQGWLEFLGGQGIYSFYSKSSSYMDKLNLMNIKLILTFFFIILLMLAALV